MTEILSRQELNALLSKGEAGAAQGLAGESRYAPFSFSEPVPYAAESIERLKVMGERFAASLRERLATELRRDIAVTLARLEILTGDETDRLAATGIRLCFERRGRRAADMLFDIETAMALVEARLGGSVGEPQPTRPLTPIEMSLLVRLTRSCAGPALAVTFGRPAAGPGEQGGQGGGTGKGAPAGPESGAGAAADLECRPSTDEGSAQGSLATLMMQLSVEGRGGMASLLVSATRAMQIVTEEAAKTPARRIAGQRIPLSTLQKVQARLVPRIQGGAISLQDLMALGPGHVVRLDHDAEEPIELLCNGASVLRGRLIRAGSAHCMEVAGWAADGA